MVSQLLYVQLVKTVSLCAVFLFYCVSPASAVAPPDQGSAEDWFYDDSDLLIEHVNEGELNFITPLTNNNTLHSETVLNITDSSLETGWVDMQQCYRNLDPIGKTDVVYRYKNIRQLEIVSLANIGKATVSGQSIHLEDIESPAHLCVQARVQILDTVDAETFVLRNGPYHRKFFDGYYPYHVTLSIYFPDNTLSYSHISPQTQSLFKVVNQVGNISVDTWFEGILFISIEFKKVERILRNR